MDIFPKSMKTAVHETKSKFSYSISDFDESAQTQTNRHSPFFLVSFFYLGLSLSKSKHKY